MELLGTSTSVPQTPRPCKKKEEHDWSDILAKKKKNQNRSCVQDELMQCAIDQQRIPYETKRGTEGGEALRTKS